MLGGGECGCKCIQKREEQTEEYEKWDIKSDTSQENMSCIKRCTLDYPAHFLFYTERREGESKDEHIDKIDSRCDLKSNDNVWNGRRSFGELMIENEGGTALEKPNKTKETEPCHAFRITEEGDDFFTEQGVQRTRGPRERRYFKMRIRSVRGSCFLKMLPESEMIFSEEKEWNTGHTKKRGEHEYTAYKKFGVIVTGSKECECHWMRGKQSEVRFD